jgi:hypothetical protein
MLAKIWCRKKKCRYDKEKCLTTSVEKKKRTEERISNVIKNSFFFNIKTLN